MDDGFFFASFNSFFFNLLLAWAAVLTAPENFCQANTYVIIPNAGRRAVNQV